MSYNNSLHGKVWKQDADPSTAAGNDDIWMQTTGGGTTVTALKLRVAGAWVTSPTVPVNTDLVTEGSTNLYLTSGHLASLFTPGQTLSGGAGASGSQTLPGGLIMKWGTCIDNVGANPLVFPTAFPTQCVNVQLTSTGGVNETPIVSAVSRTGFTASNGNGTGRNDYYLALGY